MPPKAHALRDGRLVHVMARELVPGDVIQVGVGDRWVFFYLDVGNIIYICVYVYIFVFVCCCLSRLVSGTGGCLCCGFLVVVPCVLYPQRLFVWAIWIIGRFVRVSLTQPNIISHTHQQQRPRRLPRPLVYGPSRRRVQVG